jgi:tetratricopeptide (TPR) repeat protein
LDNKDVDARKMLAEQFIIRHQYEKAGGQFIALREIEPGEADHVIAQAELAAARLQWDKAIKLYREAYDIDRAMIYALEKAAETSLRSNKLQTAWVFYLVTPPQK